jgi:hypothetical protein
MTATEAQEAVKKHGSQRAAARALGVHHGTLGKILSRAKARGKAQTPPQAAGSSDMGKGRSLADFLKAHDKATIVPAKIREGLAKLGKNGWLYESEFVKLANVSPGDFSAYRDEFAAYFVQLRDRRAWAGSEKLASQMREVL